MDIGLLTTGSSTGQYQFANLTCQSGFSEGDIVVSVLVFWVLALGFIAWVDSKIYGVKVKIRQ